MVGLAVRTHMTAMPDASGSGRAGTGLLIDGGQAARLRFHSRPR
ncbi:MULTISPECIES: hypothetical protein [unclassified Streptomyces]